MKKITAWKTSDGKVFESQEAALFHSRELKFAQVYQRDTILTLSDELLFKDLQEWLQKHRTDVLEFLGAWETKCVATGE